MVDDVIVDLRAAAAVTFPNVPSKELILTDEQCLHYNQAKNQLPGTVMAINGRLSLTGVN